MAQHMLTTVDNPFSPFTQWDDWYAYDTSHGYYTLAMLGRIVLTSDELSDADQEVEMEAAMREIVRINALGLWSLVEEPTTEPAEIL